MDTNAPGAPKRVRAAQRRAEAVRLRTGGLSYAAIGEKLGVSDVAALKMIRTALQHIATATSENTEELRTIELDRLDVAQAAIWAQVLQGDVQAIDRLIKIMVRRSAMMGIDAPTKVAPTDPTGLTEYAGLDDTQRLSRLAEILDALRARRDRPAADDSPASPATD